MRCPSLLEGEAVGAKRPRSLFYQYLSNMGYVSDLHSLTRQRYLKRTTDAGTKLPRGHSLDFGSDLIAPRKAARSDPKDQTKYYYYSHITTFGALAEMIKWSMHIDAVLASSSAN